MRSASAREAARHPRFSSVFGANGPDDHPAALIDRAHALLRRMSVPGFDRAAAGAETRKLGDSIRRR